MFFNRRVVSFTLQVLKAVSTVDLDEATQISIAKQIILHEARSAASISDVLGALESFNGNSLALAKELRCPYGEDYDASLLQPPTTGENENVFS